MENIYLKLYFLFIIVKWTPLFDFEKESSNILEFRSIYSTKKQQIESFFVDFYGNNFHSCWLGKNMNTKFCFKPPMVVGLLMFIVGRKLNFVLKYILKKFHCIERMSTVKRILPFFRRNIISRRIFWRVDSGAYPTMNMAPKIARMNFWRPNIIPQKVPTFLLR